MLGSVSSDEDATTMMINDELNAILFKDTPEDLKAILFEDTPSHPGKRAPKGSAEKEAYLCKEVS